MDQESKTPPPVASVSPSPSGPTPPPPPPTPMDVLPNTSPPPRHMPKMLAVFILSIIAVVLIIGGFGTYKYFVESTKTNSPDACSRMDCEFGCKDGKCLSPSLPPADDPTTGWKTYINNKWQFSVKYPENIFTFGEYPDVESTDDRILGGSYLQYCPSKNPEECGFPSNVVEVRTHYKKPNQNLKSWIEESPFSQLNDKKHCQYKDPRVKVSDITFADQNAFAIDGVLDQSTVNTVCKDVPVEGGGLYKHIVVEYNNAIYVISYTLAEEKNIQLLDQILSTFKFTDGQTEQVSTGCQRGGCSGQICQDASEEPLASTCEFKEEYACYRSATCERQSDGKCGWTKTQELTSCLQNAN